MENSSVVPEIDISQSISLSPTINIFYVIFLPLLQLLIIICNTATIVAFWKERSLREKPSDLLILGLSTADLCDGIALFLLSPIYITGLWPFGEIGCQLLVIAGNTFIFVSLLILMCISVDRLLLVSLHYSNYLKYQTKTRVRITIIVCWIIGLTPATIEMAMWEAAKRIEPTTAFINFEYMCLSPPRRIHIFAFSFFLVFVILPVIIVLCLSIAFIIFLRRRLQKRAQIGNSSIAAEQSTQQTNTGDSASGGEKGTSRLKSRYLKPSLTLIALVVAMIVCMTPYCLYLIGIDVLCPKCLDQVTLFQLMLLMHCNPLFDPLLYAVTQSKIRHFYRLKIKGLFKI